MFAVLRGVLVAAAITVIGVAVFALILNWWNASDRAITAVNQVVKFVSILAGVTTAMRAGESGGETRTIRGVLLSCAIPSRANFWENANMKNGLPRTSTGYSQTAEEISSYMDRRT